MKIGKNFLSTVSNDVWAMIPEKITSFFSAVKDIEMTNQPNEPEAATKQRASVEGEIATVHISGPLFKEVPAFFKYFGITATSYIDIAEQVTEAENDESVSSIVLKIESPGGTVAGLEMAVNAIKATSKPIVAHIEDCGASAAYWLACACDSIQANPAAEVGSIGVYLVVPDASKMAEKDGVKVNVISSGPLKGAGVFGSEITDEQIAAWQDNIDKRAKQFFSFVQGARGMTKEQIQTVTTGRTWLADESKKLKLIDAVETFDREKISNNISIERKKMSEQKHAEALATAKQEGEKAVTEKLDEMFAAFPENAEFAFEMFKAGKSVEEAKSEKEKADFEAEKAQLAKAKEELEAEKAEIAKAKEEAEKAKSEANAEAEAEEAEATAPQGAKPVDHGEPAKGEPNLVELGRAIAEEKNISIREAMILASEKVKK